MSTSKPQIHTENRQTHVILPLRPTTHGISQEPQQVCTHFFYLGVDRKSGEVNINPTNVGMVPKSAKEHADDLGVTERTVERWEADRTEIMSDPELSAKATTPGGYKEAKKVIRDRRETVERKGLLYALAPLK